MEGRVTAARGVGAQATVEGWTDAGWRRSGGGGCALTALLCCALLCSALLCTALHCSAGIVTTSMFQATDKFESERRDEVVAAGKEAAAKQLAKLMESDEMKNTIRGVFCSPSVCVVPRTHAHACMRVCKHVTRSGTTVGAVRRGRWLPFSAARDSLVACVQPYS